MTVTNIAFTNNVNGFGGAIYTAGTSLTVTSCTFTGNIANSGSATGQGGVVRASTTNPVNLHNSIFANNTDNGTAPNIQGTVVSQGFNLIEITTGATITGTTTGNITGQDPMLEVLANYGGPTQTHRLQMGSPAIDTADTSSFPATDQRGVMRPIDGDPNNLIAQPDIGAFEVSFGPTAAGVSIAGIVSNGYGGIPRATVVLTDSRGVSLTTRTNGFGYFFFDEVPAGEIYTVGVRTKLYQFAPQIIAIKDPVTDLVFIPESENITEKQLKMP